MQNYLARSVGETSTNSKKYAMFIGRWQPWHAGHRWLIDQALNEGKNVLICIRDVEPDQKNPWTARQILDSVANELRALIEQGRIVVMIIPDIDSVNIGRNVGYDVIEHVPPQEVHDISATKIREQMKAEGKL